MIYEEDFSYFLRSRNKFLSNQEKPVFTVPVVNVRRKPRGLKPQKPRTDRAELIRKSLREYSLNTGVHGVRYIMQKDFSWVKRFTWFLLIVVSFCGIIGVSFQLKTLFDSTPTATMVESTIYSVANIPYPAVTICNNNRLNWRRMENATEKYLEHASPETKEQFHKFLLALNTLEFGSFKDFKGIHGWNVAEMDHIDLLQLYRELSYTCEEFFEGASCWWRNNYIDCCEIFETQKTEYGLCQSFNHVLNEAGYAKVNSGESYPRRSAHYGDFSGLRLDLKVPPNGTASSGLIVAITQPYEWVSDGYTVPADSSIGITVRPTYSYATKNLVGLEIEDRQCIFPGETIVNGKPVMTLPLQTDVYVNNNCFAECRQRHLIEYCNCTIGFFFETGNYSHCTMSGIKCLNRYDTIMNYMKPAKGNPFFNDDEEGITCECWQECNRVEYEIQIAPSMVDDSVPDTVTLDVHYQKNTIVIFRTDLLYGWIDLLVGFGGIFGLFCGASLISGVEFLFYVIVTVLEAFK